MSGPHAKNADMKPLPNGWEWVPLGKYVENHDGRRIPISKKERESRSGSFPYYGASGVIDTIDGFTHDGEFLLIGEDGANLLTRSKPLAFLTRGKVWVNNHAHVLRCKPGYLNAYLAYFINSIDLSQYVTGTAQPKLSQSMMNKILIPVAPPGQQVEIVAELEKQFSRLDEAVANLQRVKANLKRYKASVLKDAVEGRLVPLESELAHREGRSFETGEQLLQRILETRRKEWKGRGKYKEPVGVNTAGLSSLPSGWTWATVEQLTYLVTSGSRGWGDFYSDNGVLFIRAQDIKTDALNIKGLARVDVPVDAEGSRSSVGVNDILVTITGANVTKSALVPMLSEPAFVSQHVALLKLTSDDTAAFVFNWLISPANGRKTLEKWAYGAGKPGLSLEQVRALPVALPPHAEQNRICEEV